VKSEAVDVQLADSNCNPRLLTWSTDYNSEILHLLLYYMSESDEIFTCLKESIVKALENAKQPQFTQDQPATFIYKIAMTTSRPKRGDWSNIWVHLLYCIRKQGWQTIQKTDPEAIQEIKEYLLQTRFDNVEKCNVVLDLLEDGQLCSILEHFTPNKLKEHIQLYYTHPVDMYRHLICRKMLPLDPQYLSVCLPQMCSQLDTWAGHNMCQAMVKLIDVMVAMGIDESLVDLHINWNKLKSGLQPNGNMLMFAVRFLEVLISHPITFKLVRKHTEIIRAITVVLKRGTSYKYLIEQLETIYHTLQGCTLFTGVAIAFQDLTFHFDATQG
jgi:hypothetical protein